MDATTRDCVSDEAIVMARATLPDPYTCTRCAYEVETLSLLGREVVIKFELRPDWTPEKTTWYWFAEEARLK